MTSQRLQQWLDSLPAGIDRQPQYWLAAGAWAEKSGQASQAASAYWHAANLDENDGEALQRLAGSLAEVGQRADSALVARRAEAVTAMRDDVESLFSWRNHSQRAAVRIGRAMQKLGRLWEAASWARLATAMVQDPDPQAMEVFLEIRGQMTGRTPWQLAAKLVTAEVDRAGLADVDWKVDSHQRPTRWVGTDTVIQFEDQALSRGLEHVCQIGPVVNGESGLWIYQSGAGGAAVIDFDLDGWPDFYLTNCDGTPLQENSATNRLYRNCDGFFRDQTLDSGAIDSGFSQGVAVGDYNSDGFPDLFVGNFGRNRLLRNNGDGSYSDVTQQVGLTGEHWTTSVAIADIDGDSHPDLFEVNYVDGHDVITRQCIDSDLSEPRSCGPLVFPAAEDRVWVSTAEGKFREVTDAWLSTGDRDVPPGRGLGLVVGELDEQSGIDLYVANDMSANHYWSSLKSPSGDFQLQEQAAVRGLAVNARSLSQASMGIAADDADGDGAIDFYLTHFTNDYNTLYVQVQPGIWSDRTQSSGLAQPTMPMLAYGTQWIDANNDGVLELIVANGNVDDFSHNGLAYRMPLQLFKRIPGGQYELVSAEQAGPVFAERRLGRSLVTVDVDRDGRVDALVTNLLDPATLLVNHSEVPAGKAVLQFQLVGTRSSRDAIGASVTVRSGGRTQTRQVLAGNGYQCSCERILRFVVAHNTPIDAEVRWPAGGVMRLTNVVPGELALVVE